MANPQKIEVGSVVRLRSGGPAMTVVFISGSLIRCAWFTDDGTAQLEEFNIQVLDLSEPDPWPPNRGTSGA